MLRLQDAQQLVHVPGPMPAFPPGGYLPQQVHHRYAFIDEEAHVALRLGQSERLLEELGGLSALSQRVLSERAEHQDLQLAREPPLGAGKNAEAVQQPQGLLWLALAKQHPREREGARLVLRAGRPVVGAHPRVAPARHGLLLSVRQPEAHLGGLGLREETAVLPLPGHGHSLPKQRTGRLVLPPRLPDPGLDEIDQAERAAGEERTGDERLGLVEDARQVLLGSLEGVPFIEDTSLPDAGIDGIFAAFCRGLDHLLIALRRLVEPALGGEYVGL